MTTDFQDDDNGTERKHRHSQAVQVQCTNIFDELQGRLKRAGSNLDSLVESSGASSKRTRNERAKRVSVERALQKNIASKK